MYYIDWDILYYFMIIPDIFSIEDMDYKVPYYDIRLINLKYNLFLDYITSLKH